MNLHNVKLAISAVRQDQFLEGLPELVFVGRSNVGKSSLINKILNRKNLARTSSTPGKTATINYFELDGKVYLVDLPGYGYARVSKSEQQRWAKFINDYFAISKNIALIFSLIDSRHNPTKDDIAMVEFMKHLGVPFVIVATKLDKLKKSQIEPSIQAIKTVLKLDDTVKVIPFSAQTGQGRDEMIEIIQSFDKSEETQK